MTTLIDHRDPSTTCAATRFAAPLPRPVRADAERLAWDDFVGTYAPTGAGGTRLGSWDSCPARNDLTDYRATIAVDGRIWSLRESACGPLAAATAMLHALGCGVEITGLHQQRLGSRVAMLVEVDRCGRRAWGLGIDGSGDRAGVLALLAALDRAV
ncbi:hypothetical protein [Williamsia deligens]|uniref:2-isopropylmalate synthase LeuA allosteric (dimerisation) domain-containing protein n=1 Tax=Williamsia deligens TaxID=321325 RepID=A0ABW3G7C3_9NOCA|nr:hypothetical protein [Williamsia deligens]MCP2193194.1 hypothetical protein [Williamsia deligens]